MLWKTSNVTDVVVVLKVPPLTCYPYSSTQHAPKEHNMASVFFFRMASLQDVPRAHQREYEKHVESIDSSKITAQEWEKSSDAAINYKFYRGMKTYLENLVKSFNEKVRVFSFPSLPPFSLRWWTCILSRQKWDFFFGNDDEMTSYKSILSETWVSHVAKQIHLRSQNCTQVPTSHTALGHPGYYTWRKLLPITFCFSPSQPRWAHSSSQRTYPTLIILGYCEKHVESIDSSKITAQEWEKPSDAAMNYRFYRAWRHA